MDERPLPSHSTANRLPGRPTPGTNLADILERVLDKGIVIAGDIRVNLLDIELLTIKIRLLVASVDKAREIGIDWWEHDPSLSSGRPDPADDRHELEEENRQLRERVEAEVGEALEVVPPRVREVLVEHDLAGPRGPGHNPAPWLGEQRDPGDLTTIDDPATLQQIRQLLSLP